jgi:glyoxylase-like metal-dependent hydrolase (beta-lactamase superfamily II)
MYRLALCSLLALILGCRDQNAGSAGTGSPAGNQPAAPPPLSSRLPDDVSVTVSRGDGWLGTYVASWKGFRTNSFWIEGPGGLILIDTQFLLSAGVEAVELAESITGKKVVAAIVLHANPDKFNGAALLQQRGIEVLTSDQIVALIPAVHKVRHGWFYERYKPDYPDQAPTPKSFGAATTDLDLAGIKVKAHVMGPGCSEAHVVLEYQKHVFVGDLVAGMGHAWLELGLLDEWLDRLTEIQALEPEHVHPGRGPSGGPELLARQKTYLEKVIALVEQEKPRASTTEAEKEAALKRVQERLFTEYAGYPLERFVEIGLPAVWDRLVARAHGQAGEAGATGAAGTTGTGGEAGSEAAATGAENAPK